MPPESEGTQKRGLGLWMSTALVVGKYGRVGNLSPARLSCRVWRHKYLWLAFYSNRSYIAGAGLCPFEWHHAEDGWALYLHPGRLR